MPVYMYINLHFHIEQRLVTHHQVWFNHIFNPIDASLNAASESHQCTWSPQVTVSWSPMQSCTSNLGWLKPSFAEDTWKKTIYQLVDKFVQKTTVDGWWKLLWMVEQKPSIDWWFRITGRNYQLVIRISQPSTVVFCTGATRTVRPPGFSFPESQQLRQPWTLLPLKTMRGMALGMEQCLVSLVHAY